MATIFDGFAKAERDEINSLLELLETSLARAFVARLRCGIAKVRERPPRQEDICDLSRAQLNGRLRKALQEAVGARNDCDDSELSKQVVNVAARHLKIARLDLPDMAHSVYQRVLEKALEGQHNAMQKEYKKGRRRLERAIETEGNGLHKICEARGIEASKMTKESIIACLAPTALVLAKESGFAIFLAQSAVIHAAFESIGVTLPFCIYTTASSTLALAIGPGGWAALAGLFTYRAIRAAARRNKDSLAIAVWLSELSLEREKRELEAVNAESRAQCLPKRLFAAMRHLFGLKWRH